MYTPLCLVLLCYTVLFTQLNRVSVNTAHIATAVKKVEALKERTLMLGLGVTTVLVTGINSPMKSVLPITIKNFAGPHKLHLKDFLPCFRLLAQQQ